MQKKKRKPNEVVTFLLKLASLIVTLVLLFTVVFGVAIIRDNNMHPRVSEGDLLIYYRISTDYIAGDVVICDVNGKTVLCRIIGKQGDVIEFTEEGKVLVNDGPSGLETYYPVYPEKQSDVTYPVTVGEDEYFVLSDCSAESESDSRFFGTVNKNKIKGKTITVLRRRGF